MHHAIAEIVTVSAPLLCRVNIRRKRSTQGIDKTYRQAAQAHPIKAIVLLFFLASISGGIPLLIYFQGLHLTRASTAGYFEMMQTLAAVCITWGFFHASLHPHQVIAAIVLIAAVAMVHHIQQKVEPHNWSLSE